MKIGQATGRVASRWLLRAVVVLVALVTLTLSAGLTDAYGTGRVLQANVGGGSDGAAPDTFWDTSVIDIPGLSVFSIHCHGQLHYDLQYGAIGPNHGNTCLAAMYSVDTGTGSLDAFMFLPVGNKVLYRCTTNDLPWIYYIGDVIDEPTRGSAGPPPDLATSSQGHCRMP